MALTRSNVEKILVNRCGALLAAAGLDNTTQDGTNSDLNDSIAFALRAQGHSVTDPVDVGDTDLNSLLEAEFNDFLDLAEYRTLMSIQGNLDDVDIRLGPRAEDFSQLASILERRLGRLQKQLGPVLNSAISRAYTAGWIREDSFHQEATGSTYGETEE